MKNLVKIMCLSLIFSGAAMAQVKPYIAGEYNSEENRNTKVDNFGLNSIIGFKTSEGMDYSLKSGITQPTEGVTKDISYNLEVRAKKTFDLGFSVKPYLGVRLGEKLTKSENFMHYAVDAGFVMPIAPSTTLDLGYRYRNNTGSDTKFDSNRYHIKTTYSLNANNAVSIWYLQAYGATAEEKNTWRLTYTYSF